MRYYLFSSNDPGSLEIFDSEGELNELLGHDCTGGEDLSPDDLLFDSQGTRGQVRYNGEFYEIHMTREAVTAKELQIVLLRYLRAVGWSEDTISESLALVNHVNEFEAVLSQYPPKVFCRRHVFGYLILLGLLAFGAAIAAGKSFVLWRFMNL